MSDTINVQLYIFLLLAVNCLCLIFNVVVGMSLMYNLKQDAQSDDASPSYSFLDTN